MRLLRCLCLFVGSFLVLDTLIVCFLSNYNLGVILPAVLGLPLMLLGLFFPHMNAGFWLFLRRAVLMAYGLGCLVLLFLGGCMLSALKDGEAGDYDALIVLGAAVHGDRVTWVLSNRLDTALAYAQEHPNTVLVVSGGKGDGETVTEASAMKGYLMDRGLEEGRILLEDKAKSTEENFRFSRPSWTRLWGRMPPWALSPPGSMCTGRGAPQKRRASTPRAWGRRMCGISPSTTFCGSAWASAGTP